jgi:hypothetical protein
MTEPRPRSFCWVSRSGIPFPQLIYDDPRVGCEGLAIIAGTEIKLEPDDQRTFDQLVADHPAPKVETI